MNKSEININSIGFESSSNPQSSCEFNPESLLNLCVYGKENAPYISPTPGEFPIIAQDPFPNTGGQDYTDNLREDIVQSLIECGFNAGAMVLSNVKMKRVMELLRNTNFKIIIAPASYSGWNNDIYTEWKNAIHGEGSVFKEFMESGKVSALYLKDEPVLSFWDELSKNYSKICALDPSKMFIVNLAGWTGTLINEGTTQERCEINEFCEEELGCKPYFTYLEFVQDKIAPGVWSYDYYPIRCQVTSDVDVTSEDYVIGYKHFFENLEAVSKISLLTHRPFWAHCRSAHSRWANYVYPPATLGSLRFEIFSALAYGAQGILYWTYFIQHMSDAVYFSALVEYTVEKTPEKKDATQNNTNLVLTKTSAWEAARQVNHEIINFKDVFLGCILMNVRHTGNNADIQSVTCALTDPIWPLESVVSGTIGVLVSHIANNNKNYLVIVSHDPINPQAVKLTFRNDWKIYEVNPIPEVAGFRQSSGQTTVFECILPPGGYMVFNWY